MSELTEAFLTAMLAYGPVALGLALLIAALGVPLPATLLLLAAGAFARQGALDAAWAGALGVLASVLGDTGGYCLGRCGGALVRRRVAGQAGWQRAQAIFARRGSLAVLLTRFALTPLALPTNLIAGSTRYLFPRFLVFDVIGELIWVVLYGGLGYLFADQWEGLSELAGSLTGVLLGLLALATGGYLAFRSRQRRTQLANAADWGLL